MRTLPRSQSSFSAKTRKLEEQFGEIAKQKTEFHKDNSIPKDPIKFVTEILNFKPTDYQNQLLREVALRIVVIWPRQSGKSTTLAARMIWFASTHDRTVSLIVAPGLRQSMIMMDRIQAFLLGMKSHDRRRLISKMQRTVVWFKNGSQIIALPNAINLLRGYTAHQVLADESAFFRNDEDVFFNVLFPMLQTTNGTLIASSTPWGKDSVFYKFAQSADFKKHVISYEQVVKAGLTTQAFIDEMRRNLPNERFRREFQAEFIEDELAYFAQDLITQCIDATLYPITDDWTKEVQAPNGQYYLGVDFGKKVDYSTIAVLQRQGERLSLVSMFRFPLETPYASVIGYLKLICEKLRSVEKILCDQTGVGEYIVEDMKNAHLRSTIEGVTLTLPLKQEILGYMKQMMQTQSFALYYDPDLVAEINVERFELTKSGQILFSHPEGTHDDRMWALALGVFATRAPPFPKITRLHAKWVG